MVNVINIVFDNYGVQTKSKFLQHLVNLGSRDRTQSYNEMN